MNAYLKQQITEANYVYYNNLIYVICDKSPSLYRLNLYECDITHKINKSNKVHIFFTNDNYSRPQRFLIIGSKNYKNAVFFPKLTKYLIYENNKYILHQRIYLPCQLHKFFKIISTINLHSISHHNHFKKVLFQFFVCFKKFGQNCACSFNQLIGEASA